ncbi:helix-turn-helix transcriptional regulator [Pantoea ananatis]|nr:LuxR C-terminal-related transcriptional regulator [Pantoea ananatis]MCW1774728.1 LuxR C-terminal-related transcriptional regulator [Pantoea ananatis]USL58994.1 response regulator transcription factor [Pantoea ananatis]UYK93062.1 LuxR C-terminal-related transcriptional regulator [Pantoea ananatis]UYL01862.1 LuxR C-terminal-related transcriptional regulator [Pantoea ananatis]
MMRKHQHPSLLTDREIAITWFFLTGMQPKEIAARLSVSEGKLSFLKQKLMRKVGVDSNNELFIWFVKNKRKFNQECIEICTLRRLY